MREVSWGLLVTGGYADVAMKAKAASTTTEFVAVAQDDAETARAYARTHAVARSYGSYAELLEDDEVEAVFVALDPVDHAEWAVRALEAGKHVLVEKPFALGTADTERVFDAAEAAGRQCIEGVMPRHHPQFLLAKKLVEEGHIGELRHIYAACTASLPAGYFRRFPERGGGGLLDLGSFALTAIRLFGGAPERVYAEEVRREGACDHHFAATLRMPGDVLAQFEVGQEVCRGDTLEVVGTTGRLVFRDPWFCRDVTRIEVQRQGPPPHLDPVSEYVDVDPEGAYRCGEQYAVSRIQFDALSTAIANGTPFPYGRADAVEQARVIEALFASAAKEVPVRLDG
ncbi:Gfo/Idh/MocA family protein [Streptomyces celluloflavus]|uniref:Gfo/Idh/MocA family protein n=1 Tax=Streptomyces celluloflavus TaxID=58344 RepID=UPI003460F4B6|nr:Gfo/Idh/MocA family oxidoreductase [Streptomyces celluloflavus]WSK17251.1 Gfo/Idh/MocA family oxidoreductase [Streptomyces celluloflavus]